VLILLLYSTKFNNKTQPDIAKNLIKKIDCRLNDSFEQFKTEIYKKTKLTNIPKDIKLESEDDRPGIYVMNNSTHDLEEDNELLQIAYSFGHKVGNTGVNEGPAYGELIKASFKKIIKYLKENCDLKKSSRFLDLGCGLGKPNIHIAIAEEIALSIGIENQEIRYNLGITVLQQFNLKTTKMPYRTMLIEADIAEAKTFVSI
jgi:hypothetical protein